jgi:hypothetical protein
LLRKQFLLLAWLKANYHSVIPAHKLSVIE